MDKKLEKVIIKNFNEFYSLAKIAFETKKLNAAVTLYYKALVELCDLYLLRNINKIGATHTERFSLLKKVNPKLYAISSKLFRFYRDSYSKEISSVIARSVKENVEETKRMVFDKEKD